ncbi:MAG: hypothetical protein PHR30_10140 [Gallionellaceae bacterium]|nr:hypothetical protein [Gallionellaceae bacterium]
MKFAHTLVVPVFALLAGCAGITPPSADKLSALPVVVYPAMPAAAGDFVYKLPASQPIELRILADGSALAGNVEQTVSARLAHDLFLHKRWASEDGRTWLAADKLIGVNLSIVLPSYEKPGPGEIHLTVERKIVE